MKKRILILIGFSAVFFSSCSSNMIKNWGLDTEARKELDQFVSSYVTDCGKYFSTADDKTFVRLKNLSFDLNAESLTEADKLNGLEWKGLASPRCTAYSLPLGKWVDCPTSAPVPVIGYLRVIKKKGTWTVSENRLRKPLCVDPQADSP